MPCWDCDDEEDLAMVVAPLMPGLWWAYLVLEDSEKDLLRRWPAGLLRKPLMVHTLRLAVLLSTTEEPLVVASAAAARAGAAVEQEASKDWREGRKEEWLAAAGKVSQQAIHSLQDRRRDRFRCRSGGGSWEGAALLCSCSSWSSSWKR
jgi:hypothetical protein